MLGRVHIRRRGLWIAVSGACILLAGSLIYRAGREERARALSQQAARLLHPPYDEAPTYSDMRATEARLLVEEAEELAATSDTRLLGIEAHAIELLQRGDAAGARRELAKTTGRGSDAVGALRAAIELADGQLDAAESGIAKVLLQGTPEPRAFAIASDVARARGQGDRALAFAENGLAIHESAALLERRGLAHELLGELPAARADLERAAQLDARPTAPLLHLGRVLRDLGDVRGAVLAFTGASQRNPRESEAWLGSGICRIGLGDRSGARADLERAEELAPTSAAPLIGLGDVDAAERDWDAAEKHYRVATKLEPGLALGWLKLGNTLMRRGQSSAATDAFRKAVERQPELAAAHNGLGAALQAQGDADGARRELEQAAKLDPADPNPLLNLARLYRQQGDAKAADTALAQAQARAPTDR
jgi:tetratricopeptide (TPR) repeat protein